MAAHGCCRAAQFYFPEGEDEAGLLDFQLMKIADIGADVACKTDIQPYDVPRVCSSQLNLVLPADAMGTSQRPELWEPEPGGQRDSGGTKRMLDAWYSGLNRPELAEPDMRAELIENMGLFIFLFTAFMPIAIVGLSEFFLCPAASANHPAWWPQAVAGANPNDILIV